jgi:hypothetical protein
MKDPRRQWLNNLRDGLLEEVDIRMGVEEPPTGIGGWGRIDRHAFQEFMREKFREYITAAAREIKKRTWPCGCGLIDDQPVFCGTHARSLRRMDKARTTENA